MNLFHNKYDIDNNSTKTNGKIVLTRMYIKYVTFTKWQSINHFSRHVNDIDT